MRRTALLVAVLVSASALHIHAWGERGHQTVNRVAVRAIADEGPAFLRRHEAWIVHLATVPDSWRSPSEPFQKIVEDPNHGWFREQFGFLDDAAMPRSRYEFVLALDREHRRLIAAGDTKTAALTNVRWTGTLPYAAVEVYEQLVAGMRRYRALKARDAATDLVELEIASYFGRLGHYIGDGAQPLHVSVHHDGWQGPNPAGYTTDPTIHGRFESRFVDLMALRPEDVDAGLPAAVVVEDPFDAVLAHLNDARQHVERIYTLDRAGAFGSGESAEARTLVVRQITRAAALLRDLAHTAWIRSGEAIVRVPGENPTLSTHPRYNPATGSAPAPRRPNGR